MRCHELRGLLISLAVSGVLAAGCGGGAESGAPSGPVSALGWDPPGTYSDNAALDPYQDLDYYELYARQDRNFTDNDVPLAQIKAVTDDPMASGNGRKLETEFILENVRPFIDQGKLYYVSLKAVGVDGQKSSFMPPISWDQRPVPVLPL